MWKTAPKLCRFYNTKGRLNFPAVSHYHLDIIAPANFLAGKFNADYR